MTDFARSRTTDQVAVADTHTYNDERGTVKLLSFKTGFSARVIAGIGALPNVK
jgi:hypothetical protein